VSQKPDVARLSVLKTTSVGDSRQLIAGVCLTMWPLTSDVVDMPMPIESL